MDGRTDELTGGYMECALAGLLRALSASAEPGMRPPVGMARSESYSRLRNYCRVHAAQRAQSTLLSAYPELPPAAAADEEERPVHAAASRER